MLKKTLNKCNRLRSPNYRYIFATESTALTALTTSSMTQHG